MVTLDGVMENRSFDPTCRTLNESQIGSAISHCYKTFCYLTKSHITDTTVDTVLLTNGNICESLNQLRERGQSSRLVDGIVYFAKQNNTSNCFIFSE